MANMMMMDLKTGCVGTKESLEANDLDFVEVMADEKGGWLPALSDEKKDAILSDAYCRVVSYCIDDANLHTEFNSVTNARAHIATKLAIISETQNASGTYEIEYYLPELDMWVDERDYLVEMS